MPTGGSDIHKSPSRRQLLHGPLSPTLPLPTGPLSRGQGRLKPNRQAAALLRTSLRHQVLEGWWVVGGEAQWGKGLTYLGLEPTELPRAKVKFCVSNSVPFPGPPTPTRPPKSEESPKAAGGWGGMTSWQPGWIPPIMPDIATVWGGGGGPPSWPAFQMGHGDPPPPAPLPLPTKTCLGQDSGYPEEAHRRIEGVWGKGS